MNRKDWKGKGVRLGSETGWGGYKELGWRARPGGTGHGKEYLREGTVRPLRAFTSTRGFLPPASSPFPCKKSYVLSLQFSPSPILDILITPGIPTRNPLPRPTPPKLPTWTRVRCRVLCSLPRNSTALAVPEEPWLTGPAGRIRVDGGPILYPQNRQSQGSSHLRISKGFRLSDLASVKDRIMQVLPAQR